MSLIGFYYSYNTYKDKMVKGMLLIMVLCLIKLSQTATAPFIPFNELHPTLSEFQFNLILNQNRNKPIIMLQYSQDKTLNILRSIIENAFIQQSDIAFAILVDCRKFTYDMNNSLGICRGYDQYLKLDHQEPSQEDSEKITETFLKLNLFSPNPTRIIQKGHSLSKNHDIQDLRELGVNINAQFLAKVIRNQIPEFVRYIEDNHDLQEYLKINSEFRLSKGPKLIYFDQNLQSSIFIKKLAINLDGWIEVAVSDSYKIAQSYGCSFEDLALLEYDFSAGKYTHSKIKFNFEGNPLKDVLNEKQIRSYIDIRKPRDILLDFEHKSPILYNFTTLKQLNQLLSHGRIILLQFTNTENDFKCANMETILSQSGVIFNYVCFGLKNVEQLLTAFQYDSKEHWSNSLFIIDGSLGKTKVINNTVRNMLEHLPRQNARQQISSSSQGQLCIRAARSAEKQPIFYYFSDKTHANSLHLMKYFGSLTEVNSLLYFCQFYLPDQEVISTYQLTPNTVFTLGGEEKNGQLQKIEHKKIEDFLTIKMFVRQVAISRMMKIYDSKIIKNQILQIKTAEELTKNCFSTPCIIGLIQTPTFHQETQLKILQEMQITYSQEGFKFYWIDGVCHFEVGKQLKLTQKGVKTIDKSYLFYYQQKGNEYSLWKQSKLNKFWDRKSAFRWVKSLRNSAGVGRIKFGIDLQDKICTRPTEPIENNKKDRLVKQKVNPHVRQDQL